MPYRLHDDLSFCQVDGHPIFLDLLNDHYFRLPRTLERAFLSFVANDRSKECEVKPLVERGILVPVTSATDRAPASPLIAPTTSAIEGPAAVESVDIRTVLEVFSIVGSTKLHLRHRKLKDILSDLATYRHMRTSKPSHTRPEAEPCVVDMALRFRRARRYVPIETRCLLDSISMVRFLARRGLRANIVFGVSADPFSAHCWAQVGTKVLNDTAGNANAHTLIHLV